MKQLLIAFFQTFLSTLDSYVCVWKINVKKVITSIRADDGAKETLSVNRLMKKIKISNILGEHKKGKKERKKEKMLNIEFKCLVFLSPS